MFMTDFLNSRKIQISLCFSFFLQRFLVKENGDFVIAVDWTDGDYFVDSTLQTETGHTENENVHVYTLQGKSFFFSFSIHQNCLLCCVSSH